MIKGLPKGPLEKIIDELKNYDRSPYEDTEILASDEVL